MLSRTADNLFWMGRSVERAENTARILDVTYRNAMLPTAMETNAEWLATLNVGGQIEVFFESHQEAGAREVIEYMALDPANPSSIFVSLESARENARATRGTITSEMWESINDTWLEMRAQAWERSSCAGCRASSTG